MSLPRYPKYKDSGVEWLGEVPEHWVHLKLKQMASKITDGAHVSPETDGGEFYFVSTKDVTNRGIDFSSALLTSPATYEAMVNSGCKPEKGDVLFSKDGTVGKTIVIRESLDFVVASSLIIIRPDQHRVDPQFLHYLCQSSQITAQVESLVKGAGLPRLSIHNLLKVEALAPPLSEQLQVAAFLDRETAKIDALVEEQRRLVELLKEKRQAVISHAITKGLNLHAKMKPSGIEWLGDVPEHWEVKRLKLLCTVQTGDKDTVNAIEDGQYPFFVRSQTVERIDSFTHNCEAVLTAGDGVGVGKVFHYHKGPFDFHQRVYMLNNFQSVSGFYLFLYIKENFYKVALEGGAKSTVDSLRMPLFLNFPITVPPLHEQSSIVASLNNGTTKMDVLTAEANRAIDLLRERRTALISAAVTGKIDVRRANHAGE